MNILIKFSIYHNHQIRFLRSVLPPLHRGEIHFLSILYTIINILSQAHKILEGFYFYSTIHYCVWQTSVVYNMRYYYVGIVGCGGARGGGLCSHVKQNWHRQTKRVTAANRECRWCSFIFPSLSYTGTQSALASNT